MNFFITANQQKCNKNKSFYNVKVNYLKQLQNIYYSLYQILSSI